MRPCPNCAHPVADGVLVCENCGAPTVEKPVRLLTGNRHFDTLLGIVAGAVASIGLILLDLTVVFAGIITGPALNAGLFALVHVVVLVGLIVFTGWALRHGASPFERAALLSFTIVTSVVLGLLTACLSMVGSH